MSITVGGRLDAPILFAHRGARAHAPENTIEAFRLALDMGATGLESDAWLTLDGEVVLDHDGEVMLHTGAGFEPRKIAELSRAQLPSHIPTLAELYDACGTEVELSIDVKDPAVVERLGAVAREHDADHRLWVCDPFWRRLASWRPLLGRARLVNSTMLGYMSTGPEGRCRSLVEAGIDAVNLHRSEWTRELGELFSGAGLVAFGWDAQRTDEIERLLNVGLDGIFSDHVDRLNSAARRTEPRT